MIAQLPPSKTSVLRASQSQLRILAACNARSRRSFASLTCSSKRSFSRPKRSVSISARLADRYSARRTAENTRIRIPAEVLKAPPCEKSRPINGVKIGTIRQVIGLLFSQGGAFNTSAGILILVFSAVLLALYMSANRALIETLRFGRENERLLEQVKEAKERLDLALQAANILSWDWDARRTDGLLGGSWAIILRVGKETSALT